MAFDENDNSKCTSLKKKTTVDPNCVSGRWNKFRLSVQMAWTFY